MLTGDAALDALGNPTRREIVQMLSRGPRSVGAIASRLPISRPAVSRHLRVLEHAGLVAHDSVGNRNVFRLDRGGFEAARLWLDGFWTEALDALVQVAESTWAEE